MNRSLLLIMIIGTLASQSAWVPQAAAEDESLTLQTAYLRSSVISAGGIRTTGASSIGSGTLAQSTPIGIATAGDRTLYAGFWRRLGGTPSGVESETPQVYMNALYRNAPNPFHGATAIHYSVARESHVEIRIFNVEGREVRTLVDRRVPAGAYQIVWDGRDDEGSEIASGVYFYGMTIGSYHAVKKMLVVR